MDLGGPRGDPVLVNKTSLGLPTRRPDIQQDTHCGPDFQDSALLVSTDYVRSVTDF